MSRRTPMSSEARMTRTDQAHFDRLYAASSDPWDYCSSDYEREKYARTLSALPIGRLGAVLEVGCSIGVFTALLAPRCKRLLAIDFSERAIELAAERLVGIPNVTLERRSFPEQAPDGPWEVVICSEVLYYLEEPALRTAMSWLEAQLRAGTSVVAVSWRGEGRTEPLRGDDVHDLMASEFERWHTMDARQPGYRLDRFDGDAR